MSIGPDGSKVLRAILRGGRSAHNATQLENYAWLWMITSRYTGALVFGASEDKDIGMFAGSYRVSRP
jgi:hypothetical protein